MHSKKFSPRREIGTPISYRHLQPIASAQSFAEPKKWHAVVISSTARREKAARQQGGFFFRENSSNGGKAIGTFWLHTSFDQNRCQGQKIATATRS
jgi:hypothetical protein